MYSSRGERKNIEAFRARLYFLSVLMATIFLILLGQLVHLQLVRGEDYLARSRSNMENYIPIPAPRGDLFDRHFSPDGKGTALVENRSSFNLYTIPAKFRNKKTMLANMRALAKHIGEDENKIIAAFDEPHHPYEQVVIMQDVPFVKIVRIAEIKDQFPNILWQVIPKRNYIHGEMYAHVIGYTGMISKRELAQRRSQGYKHYSTIGQVGIEREYDLLLRGEDGRIRRIVDVKRRIDSEFIDRNPVVGSTLVLTLDHRIQKIAFEATEKIIGTGAAVVVMKPATGEILAMVSRPSFNPNMILSMTDPEEFQKMLEASNKPLLNRTIQIKNSPSSTFKPLVALAALEEGKLSYTETFECNRTYVLKGKKDRTYFCWGRHGKRDLLGGIAMSCNIYFYNVGLRLGSIPILNYARYFGLDAVTEIDIPGEISSFVPSDDWKRKTYNQRWFDGDTLNISIGQGFLQVTPIGGANYYAGMINNGVIYKPHILKEVRNPYTRQLELTVVPQVLREVPVNLAHLQKVREGIRAVVTRGTTSYMNRSKVAIAGKTGTVQTFSISEDTEHLRKKTDSHHAWFIGYAPYDGPIEDVILVSVFVEFGRSGSGGAAPIANRIFRGIFEEPVLSEQKGKQKKKPAPLNQDETKGTGNGN